MHTLTAVLILLAQAGNLQPVPGPDAQDKARKLIRTLFEPDYARRSTDARRALARKLLDHAPKTADDPPAHYVILTEASELAAGAGDPATALAAIDTLEKAFDVDGLALRIEALDAARTSSRTTEGARIVAEGYLELADAALEADDYDGAADAASKGSTAARKARDSSLVVEFRERSKEIATLRREFGKIKSDVARLKESPDDPEGNHALGSFLCLFRGEWDRGLKHLAKGSDAALSKPAQEDLAAPATPELQVAVADGWWAIAEKERNETRKANLAARAHHWYLIALPNLRSLTRLKLEPRIAEAAKLAAGSTKSRKAIDLLSWIDVSRDAVQDGGRWSRNGKTLVSASDGNIRYAQIMIPCLPPDEYDLKLVVRKRDDDEASFWIGLIAQGKRFATMVDYDDPPETTFGRFNDEWGEDLARRFQSEKILHRGQVITSSRPTELTVSVRRNRLSVKAGEKLILDWKNPPYPTAAVSTRMEFTKRDRLFLAARDRTVFEISKIELIPISGAPRRLR